MTTKERAYLKGLAMNIDPIFQIGKSGVTPELIQAIDEALEKRELIKINVLKNCMEDGGQAAITIAERTHSQVVQVIGKKIVLYRKATKKPEKKDAKSKQTTGKATSGRGQQGKAGSGKKVKNRRKIR